MKQYNVTIETRQRGAIGVFQQTSFNVNMYQSSFSDTDIFRDALTRAHAMGLETRFPIRLNLEYDTLNESTNFQG